MLLLQLERGKVCLHLIEDFLPWRGFEFRERRSGGTFRKSSVPRAVEAAILVLLGIDVAAIGREVKLSGHVRMAVFRSCNNSQQVSVAPGKEDVRQRTEIRQMESLEEGFLVRCRQQALQETDRVELEKADRGEVEPAVSRECYQHGSDEEGAKREVRTPWNRPGLGASRQTTERTTRSRAHSLRCPCARRQHRCW